MGTDAAYATRRAAKHRRRLNVIKAEPCQDCGRREPPYNMHWDHRPGEHKVRIIAHMMTYSWASIERELAKCDLVCALCHGHRTFLYRDHRVTVRMARKAKGRTAT